MIFARLQELFFSLPQKIRFFFAGGLNTAFGFAFFAFLYLLLEAHVHYLIVLILSNFVAVVFAFLSLKFLVFLTKGNYLKEFVRCYLSYLTILAANAVLLFICVDVLALSVIGSQLFVTVVLVALSYVLHKYFSFKVPT